MYISLRKHVIRRITSPKRIRRRNIKEKKSKKKK